MNSIIEQVRRTCQRDLLIQEEDHVLVAVSGGPDSTSLLLILHEMKHRFKLRLSVAHYHHGIRGESADTDARFVEELTKKLGIPCIVERGDVPGYRHRHGLSMQEAAREVRYAFLNRVKKDINADKIALAHTRDDQVEEVILRILRGVGPDGLSGMPIKKNEGIIRPLLNTTKNDILNFLSEKEIEFCVDQSNLDAKYLRNRVRRQILPIMRSINPRIDEAILRLSEMSTEDRDYFENLFVKRWPDICLYDRKDILVLDRQALSRLHRAVCSRFIRTALTRVAGTFRRFSRHHVNELLDGVYQGKNKDYFHLPNDTRATISFNEIVFFSGKLPASPAHSLVNEPVDTELREINPSLLLRKPASRPETLKTGKWVAVIDSDRIIWPITIRSFSPGDRMRPLGMEGSRKLKNIFIDRKMARWKRRLIPIIESAGEIVWVAGIGPSETVKISDSTQSFLEIRYTGWLVDASFS